MNARAANAGRSFFPGAAAAPLTWIAGVFDAWAKYRAYLETLTELKAMSDRDLADIGLARHAIGDVAREATWGK